MHSFFYFVLINYFVIDNVLSQQLDVYYKAAVLEYAPKRENVNPQESLEINTRHFMTYMERASNQGAKIIVFPEHGLTGWAVNKEDLEKFSTQVPDPQYQISPCNRNQLGNYSKFFIDLSCASKTHKIYSVINVVEEEGSRNYANRRIYYNTNVVFDRNGVIIAKYRKINLYDQAFYTPGPSNLAVFRTDFGVTFGMFISSDILFKNPSLDILHDKGVTDIVYSSAWFSQLPFYESLSIQHGYAMSNGVNLLAAGLSDPENGNGGSGIYSYDGRILNTYISETRYSKLIVQTLLKISAPKYFMNTCQGTGLVYKQPYGAHLGYYSDTVGVLHTVELKNLASYTYKTINVDYKNIYETVCSGESNFCCTFNITVARNSANRPNYVYQLIAFHGVSKVSSVSTTLGQKTCALVACLTDNINSCGAKGMHPPSGLVFERLSVRAIFESPNSHQQPATLKYDFTPISEYMYCIREDGDGYDVNMVSTKPQDSVLNFGLISREYEFDGELEGLINAALKPNHKMLYYFLTVLVIIHYLNKFKSF